MKLAHIFTLVLGLHAVVIATLFVTPGCTSDSADTEVAAAAEPLGEPAREQAEAPLPAPAAPDAGVKRYPPTRPAWNLNDQNEAEVIVVAAETPLAGGGYVAEEEEIAVLAPVTPAGGTSAAAGFNAAPSAGKTYIVKKGDNLSTIARNNGVTLSELMAANNFTRESANRIQVGQAISIPAAGDAEPEAPAAVSARYTGASVGEEGTVYKVQSGDTLSGIAKRYQSSVRAIASTNKLSGDRIVVGQELLIPKVDAPAPVAPTGVPNAAGEVTYEVKSGDTLGAIAKRYDVTVKTIMEANGISDPRRLRVGQRLTIPTGLEPVKPTAKPAAKPVAPVAPAPAAVPAPAVTPPPAPAVEEISLEEIDWDAAPTVEVQPAE